MPFTPNKGYTLDTTHIDIWFERDRKFIGLYSSRSDTMLVCWWDEAVGEAVEDGFLKVANILGQVVNNGGPELHETALAYYKQYIYPKKEVEIHVALTDCKGCGIQFHDLNMHELCDDCLVERINGAGELELDDD